MRVGASGLESEAPIGACWYLGAGVRGSDRYRVMPRGRSRGCNSPQTRCVSSATKPQPLTPQRPRTESSDEPTQQAHASLARENATQRQPRGESTPVSSSPQPLTPRSPPAEPSGALVGLPVFYYAVSGEYRAGTLGHPSAFLLAREFIEVPDARGEPMRFATQGLVLRVRHVRVVYTVSMLPVADAPRGAVIGVEGGGLKRRISTLTLVHASHAPSLLRDLARVASGQDPLGAMQAVAALKLPRRVIGLVPMVENMPSDRSYRPSDVITMMSGLTVEIISTDAEGRMILADALHLAKQYKPAGVVDLATLTGACVIALGEGVAAGLFSNEDDWARRVLGAADDGGERLWRLPLYPDYGEKIRSDFAEIKNSGGRMGGVGTSAYFLKRFVETSIGGPDAYPWAHIDMAGMAFSNETKGYQPKGAMGYGVRLLVELARGV